MTSPAASPDGPGARTPVMIILFAILAALVAVAAIVYTIRIAPGGTEKVTRGGQRSDGQGEELTPQDRAA